MPIQEAEYLIRDLKDVLRSKPDQEPLTVVIAAQGGGAKGAWQGGVIEGLMSSASVKIVGTIGSSAGSINSYLISEKIRNPEVSVFQNFWIRDFIFALRSLKRKILWRVVKIIAQLIYKRFGGKVKKWETLLTFPEYKSVFRKLLPLGRSEVYSYIHVTDASIFPRNFEINEHPFFMFAPNEHESDIDGETKWKFEDTVALSSALPLVVRAQNVGANTFVDGGVYSNLPISIILNGGDIGADVVLCISSTPVMNLDHHDFVENRMLRHLKKLSQSVLDSLRMYLDYQLAHGPLTLSKIFLIQPPYLLKSGTTRGFFCKKTMENEYKIGYEQGISFVRLVDELKSRDSTNLCSFLLISQNIPEIGASPKMPWWVQWVNIEWTQNFF